MENYRCKNCFFFAFVCVYCVCGNVCERDINSHRTLNLFTFCFNARRKNLLLKKMKMRKKIQSSWLNYPPPPPTHHTHTHTHSTLLIIISLESVVLKDVRCARVVVPPRKPLRLSTALYFFYLVGYILITGARLLNVCTGYFHVRACISHSFDGNIRIASRWKSWGCWTRARYAEKTRRFAWNEKKFFFTARAIQMCIYNESAIFFLISAVRNCIIVLLFA